MMVARARGGGRGMGNGSTNIGKDHHTTKQELHKFILLLQVFLSDDPYHT